MEKLPDADTITEPLIFCTITGGDNGWFHVIANATARTPDEAKTLISSFVESIFPGKRKFVRTEPEADESRDFERGCRIVSGHARFSFRLEDGPTERPEKAADGQVRYMGFGR